jgi:hypothetical protein
MPSEGGRKSRKFLALRARWRVRRFISRLPATISPGFWCHVLRGIGQHSSAIIPRSSRVPGWSSGSTACPTWKSRARRNADARRPASPGRSLGPIGLAALIARGRLAAARRAAVAHQRCRVGAPFALYLRDAWPAFRRDAGRVDARSASRGAGNPPADRERREDDARDQAPREDDDADDVERQREAKRARATSSAPEIRAPGMPTRSTRMARVRRESIRPPAARKSTRSPRWGMSSA